MIFIISIVWMVMLERSTFELQLHKTHLMMCVDSCLPSSSIKAYKWDTEASVIMMAIMNKHIVVIFCYDYFQIFLYPHFPTFCPVRMARETHWFLLSFYIWIYIDLNPESKSEHRHFIFHLLRFGTKMYINNMYEWLTNIFIIVLYILKDKKTSEFAK